MRHSVGGVGGPDEATELHPVDLNSPDVGAAVGHVHGVLSLSDSVFASDFLHRGTEGDGLLTGYVQAGTCVYEFWLRLRGEWSDMFGTVVYHMLTPEASAMVAASDMAHTFAVIDSGAFDRMLAASRQMSDVAVVDSVGGTLDGDGCHLTLVTSASTLQRDDWYASLLPEKWCFCRTLRLQFDSKEWNNASVVVAESLGEDDEWSSDAPLAPADAAADADADASGKAFPAAGASGGSGAAWVWSPPALCTRQEDLTTTNTRAWREATMARADGSPWQQGTRRLLLTRRTTAVSMQRGTHRRMTLQQMVSAWAVAAAAVVAAGMNLMRSPWMKATHRAPPLCIRLQPQAMATVKQEAHRPWSTGHNRWHVESCRAAPVAWFRHTGAVRCH